MDAHQSNSGALFAHILANSSFTEKQLSIIFKRLQGTGKPEKMSSGAYYRQVKQCREKVIAILYSAVLLQSTGIIQADGLAALSRLAQQIRVIFERDSRDILPPERITDITAVTSQLIKTISKL